VTLERRTPLNRKTPLRSGKGLARGSSQLRRTGALRPVSDRRAADRAANAAVRNRVFARDGGCLLAGRPDAGRCVGRLTFHHLRKAGQGGPYTARNGVALCAGHNDWIETAQGQGPAWLMGLWCRRGETLNQCWRRLAAAGLVTYGWNGDPA
jgi:hypothetical protein